MAERIYTEEEVAALIERTVELQAQAGRRAEAGPGLTLTELEAVAAEAGLNPALLRQAAAEMDTPQRRTLAPHAGTSATHIYVERQVPGPLTDDAWEDVVAELRHRYDTDLGTMMGMPGYGRSAVEQIGRTVEWKHTSMSGIETRVLIRPRGDWLHLRFSQRVGWGSSIAEAVTYGAGVAGLAAFFAGAFGKSGLLAVGVLLAVLAAAIPSILYLDRAWRRKKHRELDALAERIAALASAPDAAPARAAAPDAAPRLDDALLDADEAAAPDRTAPRHRTRGA